MILTLFPVYLKYLQLEGSVAAAHNHLCLCGPLQTVPFGSWQGFTACLGSDRIPTRAAGAERAFLGLGGFSASFLFTPVQNSLGVPQAWGAVQEGDLLAGQVCSAGPGEWAFLKNLLQVNVFRKQADVICPYLYGHTSEWLFWISSQFDRDVLNIFSLITEWFGLEGH